MTVEYANSISACPTLCHVLRWRAAQQPDRRAFTYLSGGEGDGTDICYAELDRRARSVAALLQQRTRPGDRAMLMYPSGLEFITAFLGCLYADVVAVPAIPPGPPLERTLTRLRAIAADSRPSLILATEPIVTAAADLAAADPVFSGIPWLATDAVPAGAERDWRETAPGADTLAFLQYTSGSTTTPKGVMVSQGNLMHNEALIQRGMASTPDAVCVSWLPMFHDMGLIGTVLQPLYTGFPCVLMSPTAFLRQPVRWLRAITRYRATISGGPNFAYDLCVRQIGPDDRAALDLGSWQVAFNGAEPVRPETIESFAAAFAPHGFRREAFFPGYGLAEATLQVSSGPALSGPVIVHVEKLAMTHGRVAVRAGRLADGPAATQALAGSGQIMPGQHVVIADPRTRRPSSPGTIGEVWVAGPSVAAGYWNSPAATDDTFRARLAGTDDGPFLRTGDLGFIHDGQLFITSRLTDLIIIRGRNHAPQDIERTAEASHPALRRGCGIAFAIEDGGDARLVIAHELRQQDVPADCEEVAAAIRKAVAEEHGLHVHTVVLLESGTLPKTSSGKPQRRSCRDQFLRDGLRWVGQSVSPAPDDGWLEAGRQPPGDGETAGSGILTALTTAGHDDRLPMLVTYLRRQLAAATGIDIEHVPADQPFTALGLDSLRVLQLKQHVETELAMTVPLPDFLDHPTPARLAVALLDELEHAINAIRAADSTTLPPITPDPERRGEPFPLTEIQQAYWIGRSGAYDLGDVSVHVYLEVEGQGIDLARLERSWQQVVARHDMLRAVVLPDGRQCVLPTVPGYHLRVTDLRGQGADALSRSLAATRAEMSHQVLPAGEWPGFDIRATLADGDRTQVHISIDLLHVDGGSLTILIDEWMQLYRDGGTELPQLELSYRDYVLGEIARRDSGAYQRSAAYWRRRVRTLPPPPALPVMASRDSASGTRFERRTATLPAGIWGKLKDRAAEAGLTPSAALLAAYADVLACWSGDEAFTLNVTFFNRLPLHPQVNQILGDFTSMILLGIPSAAGKPFAERAALAQRQLWAGLEHRHISGVEVLRDMARARSRTGGVLMPVVFTSMLDLTAQGFRPPFSALGAVGEVVYSLTQTPQVWLDHQVWEEAGTLVLSWDSVADVFPPGLADDMFGAYTRFLGELAEDAAAWQRRGRDHVPLRQLAQRASVNDTTAAIPDETLLSLFLRQAAERPGQPAVITSGLVLSYEQTLRHANRLARTLRSRGARRDALVAVVMDKGWEQIVAVLGVHLAGAAYLPADPHQPAERLAYLLSDGRVRVAVTQPSLDQELTWPAGVTRVCLGDERDAAGDDGEESADADPMPAPRPWDLSHVIYTSGSTGLPKGVMIEHRNVVNRITDVNQRLGVGPPDRVFALSALHHDLSVYDVFGTLAAGAALVIPDPDRLRDPAHWAELMAAEGVTIWNSVPTFLQLLVEYLEERPGQVPHSLRCAVLAGDWIPVSLPDRLKRLTGGVEFIASGGPTETTIWDIWNPVHRTDPSWPSIPYGKPMNNTRYHVLNRVLEPCPVWVPGQLCIAGAGLARGYWCDSPRTRERFITHPRSGEEIYLSGDMGRYLPDGSIEFLGREDFQVKIGGHRIELTEVEAALRQHPGVAAAVVTAAGEPRQLTHLVAYVVPADPGTAGFSAADLAGVSVLDPVQRIDFKLNEPGIRRDTGRQAVALARAQPEAALREAHTRRSSVREFSAAPVPAESLGELLASLAQIQTDDLPKYRYPSGGGLYPVQTYVYVKPDRVASLAAGVYYHDPRQHRLLLISPGAVLDADTQLPHNRDMFVSAAFAIFLVGQLGAVEPLYGAVSRDFCLLEAGYMGQLLMTVAPDQDIGLCPVGGMDFDRVRPFFDLEASHILAHFLVGGLPDTEPRRTERAGRDEASGGLAGALREFLAGKLPAHMRPAQYVMLDRLPLTPNGKMDRRQLPAPEGARRPAPTPDTPPRNDTERALAAIAQRILQLDAIGIHRNFFDVGGTSLQMVQILNEIRKTFGRELPITEIFRHPTIGSLAGWLAGEDDTGQALAGTADRAARRRASRGRRQAPREQPGPPEEGAPQ